MKKKIDFVYTSISLAHKFKNDKFNLIEQLYKNVLNIMVKVLEKYFLEI